MPLAFVFVCQGGPLEPKALLLAASLRHFASAGHQLIAAIPDYPEVAPPSAAGVDFLRQLDVRLVAIGNSLDVSYPYAHKIECLGIATGGRRLVFLDSDILCLRQCVDEPALQAGEFAARLTDTCDIPAQRWREIYRFCGFGEPRFDHVAVVTGEPMPLCFNSGVFAVAQPARLRRAWLELAAQLNDPARFPETRPFLDQISLPLALQREGIEPQLLGTGQHWPSAIIPVDLLQPPLFAHYHDSCNLLGDTVLAGTAGMLLRRYAGLQPLLQADPFLGLLRPAAVAC